MILQGPLFTTPYAGAGGGGRLGPRPDEVSQQSAFRTPTRPKAAKTRLRAVRNLRNLRSLRNLGRGFAQYGQPPPRRFVDRGAIVLA